MDKRLKTLRDITQMALDVERMRLRRIQQADVVLLNQIDALDQARNRRQQQLQEDDSLDAALFAGADMRWADWIEREKTALNVKRAELRVRQDVQMQVTSKAFGKDEAVRRLAKKAAEEKRVKARRTTP